VLFYFCFVGEYFSRFITTITVTVQQPHNSSNQISYVANFNQLVNTPFKDAVNALCWPRHLQGDFAEIVNKVPLHSHMVELSEEELLALDLSPQGQVARQTILQDIQLLQAHGALPVLNLIKHYEQDDANPFFPTDVYSFHVDRSPVPTDTFLCTYYGDASEILPNAQAEQKVLVPEIRAELKKLHGGNDADFDDFLTEHFFDLHYRAKPQAHIVKMETGHVWRLAVDHPQSAVLPCIHRAPRELSGHTRLLLIC